MTASWLKLLPLTVNVNPGPPAFALSGESSITTGTAPGCGAEALGELYPPHPIHNIVSNIKEIFFMEHLQLGIPLLGFSTLPKQKVSAERHFLVREMSAATIRLKCQHSRWNTLP